MHNVKSVGERPILIRSIPFQIEEKRVLRELRIPRLRYVKEMKEEGVARAIKQAINAAYTLIHGQGCYRTLKLTGVRGDRVVAGESDTLFLGKNMVKLLERCEYATLLAASIGPELERRIDDLKVTHVSDAYFLDVVGGWMADYMAERVDGIIQTEVQRAGFQRTMRYSPGYGDWDLSVQPELLRRVGAEAIGVTCTETFILQPRKSVTAVVGWERAA
jgi:hypothetical protein